jgi:hypothetical protein
MWTSAILFLSGCGGSGSSLQAPACDESAPPTWHADADGDHYGDRAVTLQQCDAPAGYVANGDDCDDAVAIVNPLGFETCDGQSWDEDCDGLVDDEDPSMDRGGLADWYVDEDQDGYGAPGTGAPGCSPAGLAPVSGDCADHDEHVSPAATEICENGLDDDCDGTPNDRESRGLRVVGGLCRRRFDGRRHQRVGRDFPVG